MSGSQMSGPQMSGPQMSGRKCPFCLRPQVSGPQMSGRKCLSRKYSGKISSIEISIENLDRSVLYKGVATKSGISDTRVSCDENCTIIELPAHFPSSGRVVDTLAACDCFIAGIVPFLNAGNGLLKALKKATFLAGESVGQRGLLLVMGCFGCRVS
uniref:Uncharacterized protein n=1 Tax=Globodera rostochiensis TaxID=31243 RepID=A0A914HL27_GLORO